MQLEGKSFIDFASSQAADNKIKTAVNLTMPLCSMEAITVQTQNKRFNMHID